MCLFFDLDWHPQVLAHLWHARWAQLEGHRRVQHEVVAFLAPSLSLATGPSPSQGYSACSPAKPNISHYTSSTSCLWCFQQHNALELRQHTDSHWHWSDRTVCRRWTAWHTSSSILCWASSHCASARCPDGGDKTKEWKFIANVSCVHLAHSAAWWLLAAKNARHPIHQASMRDHNTSSLHMMKLLSHVWFEVTAGVLSSAEGH